MNPSVLFVFILSILLGVLRAVGRLTRRPRMVMQSPFRA